MKINWTAPNLYCRIVKLTLVFLFFAAIMFAWQNVAKMQSRDEVEKPTNEPAPVTIHAEKRGSPHINFEDGKEIGTPQKTSANQNSPSKVLASADFDSDGIADLVTADANGTVRFYRGNAEFKKEDRKSGKNSAIEPFESTDQSFALNISPDYLTAGDFNADGAQDLLAAAKGAKYLVLLSGSGRGDFSPAKAIAIDGQITALAAGEIGRSDGQTDIAAAVVNKKGAFLLVFEHPESAFKHKPEIFRLIRAATDLTIGNLDDDFYVDVAVAAGSDLIIVHGRGQAYPWDLIANSGIKRPAAAVDTRRMPFDISALTTGRFGAERSQSLAILGGDGNIYRLQSNRSGRTSNNQMPERAKSQTVRNLFLPTDAEAGNLATLEDAPLSPEEAAARGLIMVDASDVNDGGRAAFLKKKQDEAAEKYKKSNRQELEKLLAEGMPKAAEQREKAKADFLRSISGKPSTLRNQNIETLAAGSQFARISASGNPQKMLRVNVSDSNLDDLLLLDSKTNQIQLIRLNKNGEQGAKTEVAALDVEGSPEAILPLRLNIDALSDLVVLREGAPAPSVLMTTPAQTFIVTSPDETGDCLNGNPCSLRNAITLANQSPGADGIFFNLGSAIIAPDSQLPIIREAVTIYAGPDGGTLQIEITGVNIAEAADGLKIRAGNVVIGGLAVNNFRGVPDNNGSLIGGNGITIESTAGSPNSGNNWIFGNYLGTDRTGNLSRGNTAAGLNIFDADSNQIGGTGAGEGNVISGNDGTGISLVAGNANRFWGNIIGLNSLGSGKLSNYSGLFFAGSDNYFGGDEAGMGNTVAGNGRPVEGEDRCAGSGMTVPPLISLDTFELLTLNNTISGNRFGTNPAGTVALGNCSTGISTHPLTQTLIGSITENGRNVISDNGLDAIHCDDNLISGQAATEGGFCSIMGNNIGTDISGTVALPNDLRNIPPGFNRITGTVDIFNNLSFSNFGAPGGTTPNGACTGFCNLFSGNDADGGNGSLWRTYLGTVGVFNNYIGTNRNGIQALPNDGGVIISNSWGDSYVGGVGVDENNNPVSLGNLISGNSGDAVDEYSFQAEGHFATTYIEGNLIGTDASGMSAIPNSAVSNGGFPVAVYLNGGYSDRVFLGSPNFLARNIISGNNGNGVISRGVYRGAKIVNNLIGLNRSLNPLGNSRNGIIADGFDTQIGGSSQEANQIYANGTSGGNFAGVLVTQDAFGTTIRGNSIGGNSGLGIDLTNNYTSAANLGDGITENDCQDLDTGANDLQNFPLLDAPAYNGNGTVKISGALLTRPLNSYTIDFYSSRAADATGHGEGTNFIGSLSVTTDDHGLAAIDFTSSVPVDPSFSISATATDVFGSTSEFSCNAGASCADSLRIELNAESSDSGFEKYRQQALTCFFGQIIVNVNSDEPNTPMNLNNNICDVNPETSGDQCTLRAAIQVAEHRTGYDTIKFAIPGTGVQTITPGTALPVIDSFMYIDGESQPGYTTVPLIKLDGVIVPDAVGLQINHGNSTVTGLTIVRFKSGVKLTGQGNNKIAGCHIGINSDGVTAPSEKQQIGIEITGSSSQNQIGGFPGNERNNISNNIVGIGIYNNSNSNKLLNNRIGIDNAGQNAVPNDFGLVIQGSDNNLIGDSFDGSPNIISGNKFDGIVVNSGSQYNMIAGNFIGVEPYGTTGVANERHGIAVTSGASGNFIGGLTEATGNVISGQTVQTDSAGVYINNDAGINNRLQNNKIGVNPLQDGSFAVVPNSRGVTIAAGDQSVGRNALGLSAPNLIGGNLKSGVLVDGRAGIIANVTIQGNHIGTDGASNFGNTNGVVLEGEVTGSTVANNIVSGNSQYGIVINGGDFNNVRGNKIGTSADGSDHINNGIGGVYLRGDNNQIGGNDANQGNLIAGNAGNGILVNTGSSDNSIRYNLIGTTGDGMNALENSGYGVVLLGVKSSVSRNTISGNGLYGIKIQRGEDDPANGLQNLIAGNLIGTTSTGDRAVPNLGGIEMTTGSISNTIVTNVISGNLQDGLLVGREANGNLIQSNDIGTTKDGLSALGNALNGIAVEGTSNQIVVNVISGNLNNGVLITKTAGAGANDGLYNSLKVNKIGTDKNGSAAIPNAGNGIELNNGANNNTIGGSWENNEGNLISGNQLKGIYIHAADLEAEKPFGNRIYGNYIGTNAAHDEAIPNIRTGIVVFRSGNNIIGESESSGNVVSGNALSGIVIFDPESVGNKINYNFIGLTREGIAIGNNPDGINIDNAPQTIVGNNNICGNTGNGISVNNLEPGQARNFNPNDATPATIEITGNRIGVYKQASGAVIKMANAFHGIALNNVSKASIGVADTARNIISGNGGTGILIENSESSDNIIRNSIVGTDEDGTPDIGNGGDGIRIVNAVRTSVGDNSSSITFRTVIAGNRAAGIVIKGASATFNAVRRTSIGISANGVGGPANLGDGILISEGAKSNQIGGRGDNDGNYIAYSGGAGVRIDETAGEGNLIDPNAIFGNQGLGIDIGGLGHTPNDINDADEGGNRGQNYPEIVSRQIVNNELLISFKVDSAPGNSNYGADGLYLEFFKADANSQGERFLGFDHYTTADWAGGSSSIKTINLGNMTTLGITSNDLITATATDADSNTSEFLPVFRPTAAGSRIDGLVYTGHNKPLANVLVMITDPQGRSRTTRTNSFGSFTFDDVPTGSVYVVTVSAKKYTFAPQVVSVMDNVSGLTFTAQ